MAGKKSWLVPFVLGVIGILVWFFYWKLLLSPFLTFSDAAKFADTARQIFLGKGVNSTFAFFTPYFVWGEIKYFSAGFTPLFPLAIAAFFKFFGITDLAVILSSGIFYLAGAVAIYFLGKKVFGNLVGFLASLAFIFDPAMLNYATSGASESLFIFEIILAGLLFYLNTKKSLFLGFLTLVALYFTRPSAIIYIAGFVLFFIAQQQTLFILLRFRKKSQILKACGLTVVIWLLIEAILFKFAGKFFLYSPLAQFFTGTTSFSPEAASTVSLRGGGATLVSGLKPFLSKFLYNLYNFYKLLPQIFSPYLFGFYILSLFRWEKEREKRIFRIMVLFLVVATFTASAAFLPIYRYLHPVIPFIYLLAIETLVWILGKMFKKQSLVWLTAILLVLVFIGGQTVGKIFLDSRYLRAHTNQGKPPVYVKLSWILKENTEPDDLIITNLDTWGSWYGERKTIWFPLEPAQLVPEPGRKLKIDAIFLTSYKMEDENYYMGENWRKIFYQPEKLEDEFFAKNFKFEERFEIKPEDSYEKEGATAILLIRK